MRTEVLVRVTVFSADFSAFFGTDAAPPAVGPARLGAYGYGEGRSSRGGHGEGRDFAGRLRSFGLRSFGGGRWGLGARRASRLAPGGLFRIRPGGGLFRALGAGASGQL